MIHIGKYFGYIFNGAGKILVYPHHAKKYIKAKDEFSLEERYKFVREKIDEVFNDILKVKLDVSGLEKLNNEETYLFVPNHQSMLDPLALIQLFEKPTIFVSKKEVYKMPIVGKIDYIIDSIFLDRESPREALKMVRKCYEYLIEKKNVVIFAEGTRTKNKNATIGDYKPGSFKCAYNSGCKIVPVVIDKSYIILSNKHKNTDKVIKVSFLDPIDRVEYEKMSTVELATLVNNLAKNELERLRESK